MLTFKCVIASDGSAGKEMQFTVGDPQKDERGPHEQFTSTLTINESRPMPIIGVTPIDAVINALTIAKEQVERSNTRPMVNWQ